MRTNRSRGVGLTAVTLLLGGLLTGCGEPEDRSLETSSRRVPDAELDADLDSLIAVAESVHRDLQDYPRARELLVPALERARERGDLAAEARALTLLGLGYFQTDDYDRAGEVGQQALELKLEHDLTDQLHTSYNALGLLAYYQNRFADAFEYFNQSVAWARQEGSRGEVAIPMNNRALVETEWGDFAAARSGFLAMRDTMVAIADEGPYEHLSEPRRVFALSAALTNLGMLENRIGNPADAVLWLEEAIEVSRERSSRAEGFALGHLAMAYASLGEQGRAFDALDRALAIVRPLGLQREVSSNLEVLAEQYREAGDFRRALELYEEAREINEELGLSVETGDDLRGEAQILLRLGAMDDALAAAEEALAIHAEAGAVREETFDHVTVAEIRSALGDREGARASLAEARESAETLDVRSVRVAVALAEAGLALRDGSEEAALAALARIAADASRGGYAERWQRHHLSARALASLGQLDSAAVEGWRAVETLERVRGSYASGVLRTSFSSARSGVYGQLVETLLELGRAKEALAVSDAARGRALAEGVLTSGLEDRDEAGRELILHEIDRVIESIDLIERGITAWGDEELDRRAREALYARLADLRGDFEARLARRTEPGLDRPLRESRGALAHEVQAALGPTEALVEYFVPDEGPLHLFVVTRTAVRTLEAPVDRVGIRSRVRLARELIRRRGEPTAANAVLEGLYSILIGPVLDSGWTLGADRLVIVPHDALALLPFEALRNGRTGRYLVEEFRLRKLPTADALASASSASVGVPAERTTAAVFAPLPDELPATLREARNVGSILGGAEVVVGPRATEAAVREALGQPGPVHVASHGVMNAESPMFSRVLLAQGNRGGAMDDGRLEVHELLGLEVRAPLVFLSGCETALGRAGSSRFSPGADYTTLAQAFLGAGARSVVATLWRVDDEAAATFAESFYDHLADASPAQALSAVQGEMIGHPDLSAPYFWAGYQLLGADDPVGIRANSDR